MRIAVLHTELSDSNNSFEEKSILVDAEQVNAVIKQLGHDGQLIPFCYQDLSRTTSLLREYQPDLVFNLVDEINSVFELSYMPTAYLTALGFKYTGCSGVSLAVTTDKILAKEILLKNDLPTAPWLTYQNINQAEFATQKFIVKHRYLDGSAGLNEQELKLYSDGPELRELLAKDHNLMAEAFIDGREFALPVVNFHGEIVVLGAAETVFQNFPPEKLKIVGTLAKWAPDSFEYNNTIAKFDFTEEDTLLLAEMTEITRKCWDVLHLSSYARVDFRVDSQGRPWVLEVNGNPSIDANDWLACLADLRQITYSELINSIIEVAK